MKTLLITISTHEKKNPKKQEEKSKVGHAVS